MDRMHLEIKAGNFERPISKPLYNVESLVTHNYTSRIPILSKWQPAGTISSDEEAQGIVGEYLDSEGEYELVRIRKGLFYTTITFVNKNLRPGKNPTHGGTFTHFKFPRGSFLEKELVGVQD